MTTGPLPTEPTGLDAPPPGFGPVGRPSGRRRGGRRSGRRGRGALVLAVAFLVVGGVLLVVGVRHVLGGPAPAQLTLPAATGPVATGPLSGTWTVSGGSQAGYRAHEILFGQSHIAVGRTSRVTGGIRISGTTVVAGDFVVDMAAVQTDQAGRSVVFRDSLMETYKYPDGTFQLTRPIALDLGTTPGRSVTVTATGELTLRGVTRLVTYPLSAERVAGGIDVNAEIPITFANWHIPDPSFAIVKLGKTGTVEVLLHLVQK